MQKRIRYRQPKSNSEELNVKEHSTGPNILQVVFAVLAVLAVFAPFALIFILVRALKEGEAQEKLSALRAEVEGWAGKFPMPGQHVMGDRARGHSTLASCRCKAPEFDPRSRQLRPRRRATAWRECGGVSCLRTCRAPLHAAGAATSVVFAGSAALAA